MARTKGIAASVNEIGQVSKRDYLGVRRGTVDALAS